MPSTPDLPAQLHETHVSYVFLVGDRAVKLKKPVRFAFLDLSTRELRERACHREVELNRRLAPDVYLGVTDLVGPDGTPCDHLVVMRRMPADRRLSTRASRGEVGRDDLDGIARQLAAFHAGAERSPAISAEAERDAIADRWEAGFREIAPFVGGVLDRAVEDDVEALARSYLRGRAALFATRIAHGQVVDGHGDLLADDIFLLPDGARILDCLEFDDRLRYGDVLADVAFLAMDLERIGAPDLAAQLLRSYREFSAETHPVSLEHHYVAMRAHIRAKVACLRGDEASAAEARRLLELARAHLLRGRVVLALVGGAPATGKSTLAAGLGDALGWSVIRSDEVRKDLAGIGHLEPAPAPVGEGLYDAEATAATYAEMMDRARLLLTQGDPVVLDATWAAAGFRADAAALARATASDLVELRCDLAVETAATRATARRRGGPDPSDADADLARTLAARAEPWPTATRIDTSGTPTETLADAIQVIERSGLRTGGAGGR